MKIAQIVFVGIMFILFNTPASAEDHTSTNLQEVLTDARKGGEGSQHLIYFLENEIAQGRTNFKKLKSDAKEFAKIKKAGCIDTATSLHSEIREAIMPAGLISILSNNLMKCKMTYEQVGINFDEIKILEKKGLAVLAMEAFQDYKETKNVVSLEQYKKYMRWGELKLSDLPLTIDEVSIIASFN